eukprot:TRINITY_DN121068_c0_g1_i1.p1 TRINITY_DN121068_c0_g1~~TRINITY_DN121068_c0_g1_i1.p1  ORF type:complete len:590 (-),score=138.64 TRINITY_DN121068_c0_g1_i1:236-2005(-)
MDSGVANDVDASLYPVAVLIDELRHDDLQLRINAMKNIGTIAVALGPERTREELLPFLQEIIDDDEEVLITLAEQVGNGVPWVGGAPYAHALIGPLEELCTVEEVAVREKATESLRELSRQMSAEQLSRHVCALVGRLASHEWFTPRISVCSLFVDCLPKVSESKQDDLLKLYFRLCSDDAPMVRRQAANVLGSVAGVVPTHLLTEVMNVFEKLSRDEQDSVRILAVNNCIALGTLKSGSELHNQILPIIKACAEDKSWRVRYMAADKVESLCQVFKAPSILPLYVKLLSDQEVEVRTIAAARIAAVAALNPTKEFFDMLLPSMEKLIYPKEHFQHVRASFAGAVLSLTPLFGPKVTVDHLLNIILALIKDECQEVRLRLIGTLGQLSSVVGAEVLSQSMLPCIKELGKDRQWRVRLAVIECMPALAKYLGEQVFTQELSNLFTLWLMDPVFSVRDAAASNLKQLAEVLGVKWCELNIIPQLQTLVAHKNYLYRIAAVFCIATLAEAGGGQFVENHLVSMALKMAADPVPNVRFNAAKSIQAMHKTCLASPAILQDSLMPCLQRLNADSDPDVKFYAKKAMTELGVTAS